MEAGRAAAGGVGDVEDNGGGHRFRGSTEPLDDDGVGLAGHVGAKTADLEP